MTFTLDLLTLEPLERIDGERRLYRVPNGGLYPSATTVLSQTADKAFLEKWKQRVGEAEANKIRDRSASRGTKVHEMCEAHVFNKEVDFAEQMPFDVNMFKQIKRQLDEHVDNIRLSEGQMYSDTLKVAGTVDLVASWKGQPAIIDFKTSRKTKRKEWIEDYFLQATIYSLMLYELFGIKAHKIVIIIACESENQAQVFESDAREWISVAFNRCKLYHKNIESQTI